MTLLCHGTHVHVLIGPLDCHVLPVQLHGNGVHKVVASPNPLISSFNVQPCNTSWGVRSQHLPSVGTPATRSNRLRCVAPTALAAADTTQVDPSLDSTFLSHYIRLTNALELMYNSQPPQAIATSRRAFLTCLISRAKLAKKRFGQICPHRGFQTSADRGHQAIASHVLHGSYASHATPRVHIVLDRLILASR